MQQQTDAAEARHEEPACAALLRALWPDGTRGLRCAAWMPDGNNHAWRHEWFETTDEAIDFVVKQDACAGTFNIYHGCALYDAERVRAAQAADMRSTGRSRSGVGRTQDNAVGCFGLWLDIDVKPGEPDTTYPTISEARAAFKTFVMKFGLTPSFVVESGAGLHAYWITSEMLDRSTFKALGEKLKVVAAHEGLRADPSRTADLASVLRPPGTLNRKHSPAREVRCKSSGRRYAADQLRDALNDLERDQMQQALTEIDGVVSNVIPLPAAASNVRARVVNAEASCPSPAETPENIARVKSALAMVSADCSYERWRNAIWALKSTGWACAPQLAREWSESAPKRFDEGAFNKIMASDGERPDGIGIGTLFYLARQAGWVDLAATLAAPEVPELSQPDRVIGTQTKAVEKPADAIVALNKQFFIAPVGDGGAVHWQVRQDPTTGQLLAYPINAGEFSLALANQRVTVQTRNGPAQIAASKFFNEHPNRREYAAVVFEPGGAPRAGVFNTWAGFAVEPVAIDVEVFLQLLAALFPNERDRAYMLRWLAFVVQRPGERPEVALVVRGGKGTGKGSLLLPLLRVFGVHARAISQARHLTGNFNAHLAYAAFIVVDEAYWVGDRAAEGPLKALITERSILIERKGFDVVSAPNCVAVAFTANAEWVVPASADERRFAVFDVADTLRGQRGFFTRYHNWLEKDGAGAVLHHLLSIDLAGWDPRDVPHTAALDRQKIESLAPLDRFVWDRLTDDAALDCGNAEWSEVVRRDAVAAEFEGVVRSEGRRYIRTERGEIGRRLRVLLGASEGPRRREDRGRARTWVLPPLHEARSRAAKVLGLRPPEGA